MDDYKLAKLAANWWIEAMKKQCSDFYPHKINDDSFTKELARFESVLVDEISYCILHKGYLTLTCCFLPNRELSKLTQKAMLSTEHLPQRALMQIYGNSIEVSIDGSDLRKLSVSAN